MSPYKKNLHLIVQDLASAVVRGSSVSGPFFCGSTPRWRREGPGMSAHLRMPCFCIGQFLFLFLVRRDLGIGFFPVLVPIPTRRPPQKL